MPFTNDYHYPIRCAYCLENIDNDFVTFEVNPEIIQQLESTVGITPSKERNGDYSKRNVSELNKLMEGLKNHSDYSKTIRMHFGNTPVNIPKSYIKDKDSAKKHGLVDGLLNTEVIMEESSETQPWHEIDSWGKRFCPICGKPLLDQAGKLPMYHITMIGTSTSGKTMMLLSQYLLINYQRGELNTEVFGGNVDIQVLNNHYSVKTEDTIIDIGEKLYETGDFPTTTQEMLPNPHCISAEYKLYNENNRLEPDAASAAIIVFQDVKGENFTTSSDDRKKLSKICKKTDGVYLMTDPCTLDACMNIKMNTVDLTDTAVKELSTLISYLYQSAPEVFKKFCACILSKTDLIYYYRNEINSNINGYNITENNQAIDFINPFYYLGINTNWSKVLSDLSNDTSNIIHSLDIAGTWATNIRQKFSNAWFFPVSSIGKELQIINVPYYIGENSPVPSPAQNTTYVQKPAVKVNTNNYDEETAAPQAKLSFDDYDDDSIVPPMGKTLPKRSSIPERALVIDNTRARKAAPVIQPPASAPKYPVAYKKLLVTSEYAKSFRSFSQEHQIEAGRSLLKETNWKTIKTNLHPKNVELPLLYMLMKFGVIPDITSDDFFTDNDTPDPVNARLAAFDKWLAEHSLSDHVTVHVQTDNDNHNNTRRRLFGLGLFRL